MLQAINGTAIAIDNAKPYVILVDMTGTTFTFYEREKSKNQERKHTRAYADFRRFRRERVLNRDQNICGVPTPHATNPTNYNKWLRVHTLVE